MLELLFPNASELFIASLSLCISVLTLVFWIVVAVAEWKIFKKFGDKPWKSLVPVLHSYTVYKHTWSIPAFVGFFVSQTCFDLFSTASEQIALRHPESDWITYLMLLAVPFGIAYLIFRVLFGLRLAESFGKGTLFGVCLGLLYGPFIMILGFGKAKYLGNLSVGKPSGGEDVSGGEIKINNDKSEEIVQI